MERTSTAGSEAILASGGSMPYFASPHGFVGTALGWKAEPLTSESSTLFDRGVSRVTAEVDATGSLAFSASSLARTT